VDAVGLEAGGADVLALRRASHQDLHVLKIRKEAPFRAPVGVADGLARPGTFSANATFEGHNGKKHTKFEPAAQNPPLLPSSPR
jgi:hypothetical protein